MGKPAVGEFDVVVGDEDVAAVPPYKGAPPITPDRIGQSRTDNASQGPGYCRFPEGKPALTHEIPGKWHNDLAGKWNAGRLDRHHDSNAPQSEGGYGEGDKGSDHS